MIIIPPSLILRCVTFCHSKSRRCLYCNFLCVVVIIAYIPKVCIHLYYHDGKLTILYLIHINVMPHCCHIYQTGSDISMAIMCAYPLPRWSLSQWKYVLCFCADWPRIDLTIQEDNINHSNTCSTVRFYDYHIIALCSAHVICPLNENKVCHLCLNHNYFVPPTKIYTRKYIVMMETSIAYFHTSFYFPEIRPHMA